MNGWIAAQEATIEGLFSQTIYSQTNRGSNHSRVRTESLDDPEATESLGP